MNYIRIITICLLLNVIAFAESKVDFYNLKLKSLAGEEINLADYRGKVVLVVNTASRCGFTPQYSGLQELNNKYSNQGFSVIGAPSGDFLNQEFQDSSDIKKFCIKKYGVKFPLLAKTKITGKDKSALFKFLTEQGPKELQGEVAWNFEKFLIDRQGKLRFRFGSFTGPNSKKLIESLSALLNERP